MRSWCVALAIVVSVGGFYVATLREGHDWGDDFSLYIAHAKNISEARAYRDTGYLYNPNNPIGPPAAPPVFPLLLAPVYTIAGLNLAALKLVPILCFLISLAAMFATFRRHLPPPLAAMLLVIVGFNPLIWELKDQILSDFPFLCFVYLSFLCIERTTRAHDPARQTWLTVLTGTVLYLAIGTREVGLSLIVVWGLMDLLTVKRLTRPMLIATVVCVGLMGVQRLVLPEISTQGSRLGQAPWMIPSHLSYYSTELRDLWRNGYVKLLMKVLFATINGLAIFGYGLRLRLNRGFTIYELFPLVYVPIVLLWPDFQGIRYLLPVVPLYIFYCLVGLQSITRWCQAVTHQRIIAGLISLIVISYAGRYTKLPFGPLSEGMARPETRELFAYLTHETTPDSIVICAKPRAIALFTGRRSGIYHSTTDDAGLLRHLETIGADYAVTSGLFYSDQHWFQPLVERHPERFEPVYTNAVFHVYRFHASS